MSKYFTVREPLTVQLGNQSHTFYIRELPYQRRNEILKTCGQGLPTNDRGFAIVTAFVLECVEEEDTQHSYDAKSWADELEKPIEQISLAVLKAQGIDLEKIKEEPPVTEEQAQGNSEPSRTSGMSSASTSAAALVN